MGLKVITPPATEPVSLAEAKLHLRVDHSSEDDYITALIQAAREACEHNIQRAIAEQTLELSLDEFPDDGIYLPMPPVQSITSVTYIDTSGDTQTVDSNDYYLDDAQEPSWVLPVYGGLWPVANAEANSVKVRYVAGYETCPEALRQWILLVVGSMYHSREASSDRPASAHDFVDRLLDRYRVWAF